MKLVFGDVVVVHDDHIGVVVKSWRNQHNEITHEVYVRQYNAIMNFKEDEIERYMVRHKYLSEEELKYQRNATE